MSDKILKLSQAQTLYQDLRERIDALPTDSDIPEVPVQDVQVNGTSVLSNGVANIPAADANNLGVIRASVAGGLTIESDTHYLRTARAASTLIKAGTDDYRPIVPNFQHQSVFYGLAKAAGDTTQSTSSNAVGAYTDNAKQKIQNMLGITDLISTEESSTATAAHALNSTFMMDGKLCRATAAIAIGDAVAVGTNCEVVKADEIFIKNTDDYVKNITKSNGDSVLVNGIFKISTAFTISGYNELVLAAPSTTILKAGTATSWAITPSKQHEAIFFGLSKLAGVDLASETVTVGTYPETSKVAIQNMLDIPGKYIIAPEYEDITFPVLKWTTCFHNGNLYYAKEIIQNSEEWTESHWRIGSIGDRLYDTRAGIDTLTSALQIFYVKPSTGIPASDLANGVIPDIQINGTSILSNGVASIPVASSDTFGVVKIGTGLTILDNRIIINPASVASCKAQTSSNLPITPMYEYAATFYGLATAAGDSTQSSSDNAVGTYTAEAKAAIHTMLGIDPASIAAQVDIPLVETVSGTTPTITGQPNVRYVCGEVSTISITPPASGSVDVIFESGSTATVMTVPSTVKWPAWFDAEALEADTTYEILITDGIYGAVMSWAD